MDKSKKNIVELSRYTTEEYRALPKLPLKVAVDNVRSMHNIGSVFRTCDAFLVDEIILGGISGQPPHPEISKTAIGAENTVKWHHTPSLLKELEDYRNEGWKIAALEQTHNSIPLQNFRPSKDEKLILVVGNEVTGVDQTIVNMADYVLEIPQFGTKHSLNVSVCAGIALFQITCA